MLLTLGSIDLGLAQIYPIWDEDTDEERVAVGASFADSYVAILRDDSSLLLLQADDSGDLDEVSLPDEVASTKWRSSCLYHDKHQTFKIPGSEESDGDKNLILLGVNLDYKLSVSSFPRSMVIAFKRIADESVQILTVPDMKVLSVVEGVDCLQPVLSAEPPRRSNTREPLKEIIIADLGDSSRTLPYLIVWTTVPSSLRLDAKVRILDTDRER